MTDWYDGLVLVRRIDTQIGTTDWYDRLVRRIGMRDWYDGLVLVRRIGTTDWYWYDGLVRRIGTTDWYDGLVRRIGTTDWYHKRTNGCDQFGCDWCGAYLHSVSNPELPCLHHTLASLYFGR